MMMMMMIQLRKNRYLHLNLDLHTLLPWLNVDNILDHIEDVY